MMLWVVNIIAPTLMAPVDALFFMFFFSCMSIGLQVFLGIKGNEMTAKNYLEHDWVFVNPDSEFIREAKIRWGISV